MLRVESPHDRVKHSGAERVARSDGALDPSVRKLERAYSCERATAIERHTGVRTVHYGLFAHARLQQPFADAAEIVRLRASRHRSLYLVDDAVVAMA